jgi:hypothetical protein
MVMVSPPIATTRLSIIKAMLPVSRYETSDPRVTRPQSKRFTRRFLVVTPGITIKDRLRVLQPNDPDSYYASRELVPEDVLEE